MAFRPFTMLLSFLRKAYHKLPIKSKLGLDLLAALRMIQSIPIGKIFGNAIGEADSPYRALAKEAVVFVFSSSLL